MLCRYSGQTQREATAALGVRTGATVSIQMKRLSRALAEGGVLRRRVDAFESALRRHPADVTVD